MSLPELFGSYLLHHRLARGTTSEVYLAQTTGDFPRLCAVKCILPEVAVLPGFGERFRQDAALLVRMIHGNLVQVLEVGAVDERLFIAMEQIDGVALPELFDPASHEEHGPLPPELALYVGLELCEAVTYISQHRREAAGAANFAPDAPWPLEVMLAFDGVVKVMDLGSYGAIRLGKQKVSQLFQAPGYAVPEVILKRSLNTRSDLFAIGLVIWEILEGRRLVADDPEGYIGAVLKGSWRAPLARRKDVAGDVIRLVDSMLKLDPGQRPANVEAVRERLVDGLRRLSPAYGSAAVSQLLWRRCHRQIQRAERMVGEVMRRSPTERDLDITAVSTQSFGQAGKVDRHVDPPAKLKTGDVIPGTRYRLVRPVGRGGSAEVFAAQHVDLDRQVAIKILSSQLAANSAAIAQFRMEARACSRVGHPNIVEVIDFGELEDGRFFFAMELLEGQTLADMLDQLGHLPLERAIGVFRQIAKALQASHGHGIVHRDIKPENVMLITRDGREDFVKLLDYGVMAFASDTRGLAVGTAGYMAPEQVSGSLPSPAMDIYAVGTTLYEALCGQVPYPAESYEAFVELQSSLAPPALRSQPAAAELPEGIERVVHKALERDPAARHQSMADFEEDLLRAQRTAGVETQWDDLPAPGEVLDRRPSRAQPSSPRVADGRGRVWLVAAGVGVLALVAAVTLLLYSTPSQRASVKPASDGVSGLATAVGAKQKISAAVQALLGRAEAAAAGGRFTRPTGSSALDLLERVEREAPGNEEARRIRKRIAVLLEGAGDRLDKAGLTRSARTLYQEALLFAPDSARLALLARRTTAEPGAKRGSAGGGARPGRPPARMAEVAWLLSQVQLAVVKGHYLQPPSKNALHFLMLLKRADPTGKQTLVAQRRMTRRLREKADLSYGQGRREEARALYRLITALDPEDAVAKRRATLTPDGGARRAEVRKQASPVPRAEPTKEPVDREKARRLVEEGQRLLRQGQLSEAQRRFQAAVEANPAESRAVAGLATVAFEREHYPQTVVLARRAVSMNPRSPLALLLLGDAYFKLLRYNKALDAWRRVLKLDPANRSANKRIAHVQAKMSD